MEQKKLQIKKEGIFPTNLFGKEKNKNEKKPDLIHKVNFPKISIKKEKNNERLFKAINKKKIEKIKSFISEGVNLNVQDENGWTPLIISVMDGHDNITRLLLNEKVNVNIQNKFGSTALHHAYNSNYEILEKLLKEGADINIRNDDNRTPIMDILFHNIDIDGKPRYENSLPKLYLLIEELANSTHEKTIHHAIELLNMNTSSELNKNIIETIKKIAQRTININKKNKDGETPIIFLAKMNIAPFDKIELTKSLIEGGALLSIKDKNGKGAIDYIHYEQKELRTILDTISWLESKNKI